MTENFVTAFTSHELEDRVIEVLSAHGYSLLFRALTNDCLKKFIVSIHTNERLLVLSENSFELDSVERMIRNYDNIITLSVNRSHTISPENLISAVNDAMRQPVFEKRRFGKYGVRAKWISVTGSSTSPGTTTIALNVASELANIQLCVLIDDDSNHNDLHIFLGTRHEGQTVLTPTLTYMGVRDNRDKGYLDSESSRTCVFDMGQMPIIHSRLMADRRSQVRETLDRIFECKSLLYALQPDHRAVQELNHFLDFANHELPDIRIAYAINRIGKSQRERALVKSLRTLLGDNQTFLVPRSGDLFDRAQSKFASISEVGARTQVHQVFKEISVYLSNSI